MTEPLKYAAKMAAKGLDTTGVTEDHARAMVSRLMSGSAGHYLFVVEGKAAKVITDSEGNQQVVLTLTQVEPVPYEQEETVREFMRALYRSRPDQQGQAVLRGTDDGPTVADAASGLSAQVERDDDGAVTGVWDGSTDGPLPDLPDTAYDADSAPYAESCGFPGCVLNDEHDGDHEVPEVSTVTDDGSGEETGHVVAFSGRKAKG